MRQHWKTYGLGFLFWTAIGLLFTGQQYLLQASSVDVFEILRVQMLMWYLWGLSAPCLAWLDRRLPYRHPLVYRLISRMALGMLWTAGFMVFFLGILVPVPLSRFVQYAPWHYLVCLLILGVSIGRDYYVQVQQRQLEAIRLEKNLTEARLQALRGQLNPHFLFNTMNTISSLVEENPHRAREVMEQLGTMLRFSLDSAHHAEIRLEQELTHLALYTDIIQTRFDDVTVDVVVEAAARGAFIPPFLLQPLVENAVQHGIMVRARPGAVKIKVAATPGQLQIAVVDDGVGLPEDWQFEENAGVGLRNTQARLFELYGEVATLTLANNDTGGTTAHIALPLRNREAGLSPKGASHTTQSVPFSLMSDPSQAGLERRA